MSKQEHKDREMQKDMPNQEQETENAVEAAEQVDNSEKTDEDSIESKSEILKAEIDKEKNNFLRLFAEFENYKKRTSRERIELFSTANKELMTVLLPILDDFERGLKEIEKSSDEALLTGMQLIYNKFKNTLNQKGLKEVEVKEGDTFDPEIHEAITQIPAPSKKLKGKIIDTVEKGYKLGETIIRYPKVVLGN